jgi:hypothetical protein
VAVDTGLIPVQDRFHGAGIEERGRMMIRIALAALLLALTGCVAPMPEGDFNGQVLRQARQADGPVEWRPRTLFE